jgi:polar amino acid transport system substrate-binding protein
MVGMTIDREPFYKRELELKLSMSYGPGRHDPDYEQGGHDYPLPYVRWTEQRNMEAFLQLIADSRVTPKALVSHRFAITEAEKAYVLMETGESHLAILLDYPEQKERPVERWISRAPAVSLSKSTGVAFIGLGNYAKSVLLPAVRNVEGVRLTAVVTSTGISASHAGVKHGFATISTDPAAALEDPATSAVFIVTRHDTHARLAAAALRAGKHVFCEKPLALDHEGFSEVTAAARETDVVVTVGFNRRFAPLLVKAKAALEPRSGPLVMLYRVNAGQIPADNWIKRGEGGGRIIGEVCHFVDAMAFLAGSVPVEVSAVAAAGHDDAFSILIRFADGSTGTIVYSSLGDAAVAKELIEVFAAGRVVQLDDFRRLIVTASGKASVTKSSQDKGQAALVRAFLAAVRGEQSAPITFAELAAVTEATFAIEDALRAGAVVALNATH